MISIFSYDKTWKCLRTGWRTERAATKHNPPLPACLREPLSVTQAQVKHSP